MGNDVNAQQDAMWNGYEGQRWAEQEDRWDSINGAFNDDLFTAARIGAADAVLDVGCGNGQTTRLAAERTTAEVVGLDISVPLIEQARVSAQGVPNVRFEHGDAQIYPFADGAFDVVISRFGLTFFEDPIAALANINRAIRSGGRLASVCVGDYTSGAWAPILGAMVQTLQLNILDAPNPRDALADPDSIERVLGKAGFVNVATQELVRANVWGRDPQDAADFLLNFGPIAEVYRNVDAEIARRARDAVVEAFQPYAGPLGVAVPTPAWLTRADRP